jgi:beta-glucosidase
MNEEAASRRIEELLGQMTLEEKVAMTAGTDAWHSTGVERLGIPSIKMTDGPKGARGDGTSGTTSASFPVGAALAATWDPELIREVGSALGEETKSKDAQVLLGPTVNIHRHPLAGRNFECYSEDPYLSGRMAVAFVQGVQSQGAGTSVKHFVCNDSEFQRFSISSEVDERTLREIYLLPFEMAVREADPWTIMGSYNRLNGVYACGNHRLLTEILRDEWGFRGFVVTDWVAQKEGTATAANAGLDLEMPGPARDMGAKLLDEVRSGTVDEATVDDIVRRLLRITILSGRLDDPEEKPERSDDRPEHRALARRVAAEGMVLLKNDRGVLPLDRSRLRMLAVIGPNAEVGVFEGGGSSRVSPHYVVHPLEAIRERCGDQVTVVHERGCLTHMFAPEIDSARYAADADENGRGVTVEYFDSPDCSGEPVYERRVRQIGIRFMGPVPGVADAENFSCRWSTTFTPDTTGTHTFGITAVGLGRLLVDGVEVLDNWTAPKPGTWLFGMGSEEVTASVEMEAGKNYQLAVEYNRGGSPRNAGLQFGMVPPYPEDLMQRAVAAAKGADAAVLVVGTNGEWETEGNDRLDMELPGRQRELIEKVAAANPKTVVVMNAGSPVAMDWLGRAPAVLQAWFPGQEFGNALADVLFGDASPSGKLPTTFPRRLEDSPAFANYPGENGKVSYEEGVFVGYRGYDARDVEPLFPFGHGLSYTTFEYGEISVTVEGGDSVAVEVDVTNAGQRAGQEVVQCYVRDVESSVARPPKELKGLAKLSLKPGQTATARIVLDRRAFSFYDPARSDGRWRTPRRWVLESGEFELLVGSSSRDIRAVARVTLGG